jgi:integrase
MRLLAATTQARYQGIIDHYLLPVFGDLCLRDLDRMRIQQYFSKMVSSPLSRESKDKIRDVLSSVLGSAREYGLIINNPVEGIRLPREKRGRRRVKPYISPEQFDLLLSAIPEPYSSMLFVAVFGALRVSELLR